MIPESCWSTFELGKPGVCLQVQADGVFHLLPYSHLLRAEMNEAETALRLEFSGSHVSLQGEGLMPIFHQLQLGNLRRVRLGSSDGPRVASITVEKNE